MLASASCSLPAPRRGRFLQPRQGLLRSVVTTRRAAFQTRGARTPRGGGSLYNTAGALSLRGDKAGSLDYLHKSLEAGFDDVGLFRKDDDLDNVRGEPRYRELLKMAQDLELHRFDDGWSAKSWTRAGRRNAWRETEQHFVQYTQSHPQSGRAWSNLGYARIEGERPEGAVEVLRRALELRYRPATTMYNLACAYSLMDRKDDAFTWLFKALDRGSTARVRCAATTTSTTFAATAFRQPFAREGPRHRRRGLTTHAVRRSVQQSKSMFRCAGPRRELEAHRLTSKTRDPGSVLSYHELCAPVELFVGLRQREAGRSGARSNPKMRRRSPA